MLTALRGFNVLLPPRMLSTVWQTATARWGEGVLYSVVQLVSLQGDVSTNTVTNACFYILKWVCTILNVTLLRRLMSLDVNPPLYVCVCVSWGWDRLLYLPLKPFITESPLIFCPSHPRSSIPPCQFPLSSFDTLIAPSRSGRSFFDSCFFFFFSSPHHASLSTVTRKNTIKLLVVYWLGCQSGGRCKPSALENWLCFYATALITPRS